MRNLLWADIVNFDVISINFFLQGSSCHSLNNSDSINRCYSSQIEKGKFTFLLHLALFEVEVQLEPRPTYKINLMRPPMLCIKCRNSCTNWRGGVSHAPQ